MPNFTDIVDLDDLAPETSVETEPFRRGPNVQIGQSNSVWIPPLNHETRHTSSASGELPRFELCATRQQLHRSFDLVFNETRVSDLFPNQMAFDRSFNPMWTHLNSRGRIETTNQDVWLRKIDRVRVVCHDTDGVRILKEDESGGMEPLVVPENHWSLFLCFEGRTDSMRINVRPNRSYTCNKPGFMGYDIVFGHCEYNEPLSGIAHADFQTLRHLDALEVYRNITDRERDHCCMKVRGDACRTLVKLVLQTLVGIEALDETLIDEFLIDELCTYWMRGHRLKARAPPEKFRCCVRSRG